MPSTRQELLVGRLKAQLGHEAQVSKTWTDFFLEAKKAFLIIHLTFMLGMRMSDEQSDSFRYRHRASEPDFEVDFTTTLEIISTETIKIRIHQRLASE